MLSKNKNLSAEASAPDLSAPDASTSTPDVYAERPVHKAASLCTSVEDFQNLIQNLTSDVITDEVLTISDDGKTVFDLIKENNYLPTEIIKDEIVDILLKYALKKKVSPLKELITDEELSNLLKEFKIESDSEAEFNFKEAVALVNLTRTLFEYSTTHPETNDIYDDMHGRDDIMEAIRHDYDHRVSEILHRESKIKVLSEDKDSISFACAVNEKNGFQDNEKLSLSTRYGNCEEMARFAHMVGQERKLQMTTYGMTLGDHVVTTVGKEPNQMVCDPWAKQVFPFSMRESLLGSYKCITHRNKIYNLMMKFNPSSQLEVKNFNSMLKYQKITIEFTDSFVDRIIKGVVKQLEKPEDKFLFAVLIRDNLSYALEHELIEEREIIKWKVFNELESMLKNCFSADHKYFPSLVSKYKAYEPFFKRKLETAIDTGLLNINDTDGDHRTALYFAASLGHVSTVEMLLARGADQNRLDAAGTTAIFSAAANGNEFIVDLLLKKTNTLLVPMIATEEVLYEFINSSDQSIMQRMEDHIAAQIGQGETIDSISMTPEQIAYIMGHDSIAFKLRKFAEASSQNGSSCTTGLFSPAKAEEGAACVNNNSSEATNCLRG